jgi:aspartate kinase
MKIIVQKFGGTSLDTHEKRILAISYINKAIKNNYKPIVIVSAMGRLGEPYATDTLINVAKKEYNTIESREKDLLMSCGEIISAVVMVQALRSIGIEAAALSGAQAGIITDNNYTRSRVLYVNPEKIIKVLDSGKIPVIAGFQGISEDGEITTLGRGGSDTTASVIAVAVRSFYIEIYTDVDGIMTADPVLVKMAKKLDKITYNEVCELAYQGAIVIHPRAAEIAMREGIPIRVKSIYNQNSGTIISNYGFRGIKGDRMVTGITSRNNIIFIKIIPKKPAEYATGLIVFKILAENNISVDFINIQPEAISFIVEDQFNDRVKELLEEKKFNYHIANDFVKVSVVGGGMTGRPGVMARIVEALNSDNIFIYQTTDSHTTISCLLKKNDEKLALNVLHKAFNLDE